MLNDVDLSRTDLNLLVVFEVVLRERHVGRAAASLHLTSSAVSHGLGRLRRLFHDPLFLRTPKGVVPTARAEELAGPIADILVRTRSVVATAAPFDPKTSTRRFAIGAPDGSAVVLLPAIFAQLPRAAPGIDLTLVHALPMDTLARLEARTIDLALAPLDDVPPRFVSKVVYEEEFVIAARKGHPFLKNPTLKAYCSMLHALVSTTGDPHGHIDEELAAKGVRRRVAFVAPNFMVALAALADTDLLCALPSGLVQGYAKRFGVASVAAPIVLRRWNLRTVVPKAAMTDAGLMWLVDVIDRIARKNAMRRPRS
jgi:DNA-binding transcriptional LysR family regulator